jgi:hypothetical protein
MLIHLMVRGFLGRALLFADPLTATEDSLRDVLPGLAEQHATAMAEGRLTMIELEFLDEPDPLQRFFRLGTDPSGMVIPIEIDLGGR